MDYDRPQSPQSGRRLYSSQSLRHQRAWSRNASSRDRVLRRTRRCSFTEPRAGQDTGHAQTVRNPVFQRPSGSAFVRPHISCVSFVHGLHEELWMDYDQLRSPRSGRRLYFSHSLHHHRTWSRNASSRDRVLRRTRQTRSGTRRCSPNCEPSSGAMSLMRVALVVYAEVQPPLHSSLQWGGDALTSSLSKTAITPPGVLVMLSKPITSTLFMLMSITVTFLFRYRSAGTLWPDRLRVSLKERLVPHVDSSGNWRAPNWAIQLGSFKGRLVPHVDSSGNWRAPNWAIQLGVLIPLGYRAIAYDPALLDLVYNYAKGTTDYKHEQPRCVDILGFVWGTIWLVLSGLVFALVDMYKNGTILESYKERFVPHVDSSGNWRAPYWAIQLGSFKGRLVPHVDSLGNWRAPNWAIQLGVLIPLGYRAIAYDPALLDLVYNYAKGTTGYKHEQPRCVDILGFVGGTIWLVLSGLVFAVVDRYKNGTILESYKERFVPHVDSSGNWRAPNWAIQL